LDKQYERRPYFLLVDGVLADEHSGVAVSLVLPPQYGSHSAQRAIEAAVDEDVAFEKIIVVGIAGLLDKTGETSVGDVVVSNRIYDSAMTKAKSHGKFEFQNVDRPFDRWGPPQYVPSNWVCVTHESAPRRKGLPSPLHPKIVCGDVVSGSTVVKALKYKAELQGAFPTCKAVEMEGLGCCYGAARSGVPVRIIKGICDKADFRKSKEWQPYCADVAASFAAEYVLRVFGHSESLDSEGAAVA
jgi:nucleoside phosphorylase